MQIPAHILGSGSGRWQLAWIPVGVAVAGVLAWAVGRPALRKPGLVVAAAGLAATLVVGIVAPGAPARPAYILDLEAPQPGAHVTSPMIVLVCAHQPDGSAAQVPGQDRVLSVSVDGAQLESVSGSSMVIEASPGTHDLRVDVLTSEHRAYDPPVEVDVHVAVTGVGPLPANPSCPR
jgi:hypothetical protein